jgi:hypothetical protein
VSIHRRDARRDPGEVAIVQALEDAGASVTRISGDGVPDLLVGYDAETYLLEVKAPLGPRGGKTRDGQRLKPSQENWKQAWRGAPPHVVRSPQEALEAIGAVARTL